MTALVLDSSYNFKHSNHGDINGKRRTVAVSLCSQQEIRLGLALKTEALPNKGTSHH